MTRQEVEQVGLPVKETGVDGLTLGKWEFDVFLCDDGRLGFTVYDYGKSGNDETASCNDIFVGKDNSVNVI